jgi:hypothetical protein
MEEAMRLKILVVAGAMLAATSAFAQTHTGQSSGVRDPNDHQQQPQTPGNTPTNAQGQQPKPGQTMQEKDTSITNDEKGAKGAPGSSGTQSGTSPNGAIK